ncbi:hypothetical protein ABT248_32355 [Streptomyces sp. NPDC000971]|uniref:hypothetical protein n=1 Tax=Streptomyces TaxID=1883 RepID=UPI00332C375D
MRSSPYADVLGATGHQAPDVETIANRLTEMRETRIPARIQQINTDDEKRVSRAHGQATKARENAAMYRSVPTDARTEEALRARIAEQHPRLHESEVQARAELQQSQQTRSRIEAPRSPRYQPPALGRSGPSRGRR